MKWLGVILIIIGMYFLTISMVILSSRQETPNISINPGLMSIAGSIVIFSGVKLISETQKKN
jgi:hypothetical protein